MHGKTVAVRGKFIKDYKHDGFIDLGACPLAGALLIDGDDLARRYPDG
jgi:hypothetical protein